MKLAAALPALLLLCAPPGAAGQGLGARITAGGDGVVRMSYRARAGVEICYEGFDLWGRRSGHVRTDGGLHGCAPGPVVVELRVRGGEVRDVEALDRHQAPAADARDLGSVEPRDAVAFLLDAARRGGGGRGLEEAIFPAMMADVPDVWRAVLALAEDATLDGRVRRTALFWVGQEAADAATEGLAAIARDRDEEEDVREAAVFALSQRPEAEGVPILMEVARTAENARTRRSAFFWLAQSHDPRVAPFFREILHGRRGG